ncbi:MAG: GAF domain-containing protein [Verrucomicrobiota bacterium]
MADLEIKIDEGLPADYAELKKRYERLHLLYQVNTVIHSTLESGRALDLIISEAVRVLRGDSGSIALVNPNNGFLEMEASVGLPPEVRALKLRVGEGITGWVAKTGKAVRIGDVNQDPRYIMLEREIRSELAVPLEVGGELRGVINVDSARTDAFTADDEQLLRDLSLQAAQVIQNTWLYEQIRHKARLFESLISVSQTINSTLNLDEALRVITREACQLMRGKLCSLMMLDSSGNFLELRASYGASDAYINKPRLDLDESLLGAVIRRKKPLQIENVQISSRYQHIEIARQEGLVSLLSVPLLFSARIIGTLNVYTPEQHVFSNEEIRILAALAELSGIAIAKASLYERIVDIEEQLRQNEKLSAIGLLAAEVAHEIRNPLTVIKMLFHSLDLKFADDDARARDMEVIHERMDHLNKIVQQILQFARNADPTLQPTKINSVIEDLALLVRHKLSNQKIEFTLELAPELPEIPADSAQLSQALLNLVLNAVEAMPVGGRLKLKTSLHLSSKREQIQIEVSDSGRGLTPEQQKLAFRNLLNSTHKGGTGLGLAIVGKIIQSHQGEITAQSRPGAGTTIRIRLPIQPSTSA